MDQIPVESTSSINTQVSEAPPVPPSTKTHKQLISILLGITAFALGAAGYFGYKYYQLNQKVVLAPSPTPAESTKAEPTSTPDPTTDWKTYTSNAYGFSFRYPPELSLTENCVLYAKGNYPVCLQSADFSYLANDSKIITEGFGLFVAQDSQDYQDNLSTLQKDYQRKDNIVTLITTNAIPMIKVSQKNTSQETNWIMIQNKNVYRIFSPSDTQKYPVIDQILSTFRFSDQTSVDKSAADKSATLVEAKAACIELQGLKYWDEKYRECNEAGTTQNQLKTLCQKFNGVFEPNGDTCRHGEIPCGPEATYYCSFSNLK